MTDPSQACGSKLPPLSEALILRMEALYPDQAPDLNTPERQIWHDAGAASVVRFLRGEFEYQKAHGAADVSPFITL